MNIKINENYDNLKESYLFSETAKRINKYSAENPDKKVIKLSPETDAAVYGQLDKESRHGVWPVGNVIAVLILEVEERISCIDRHAPLDAGIVIDRASGVGFIE